MTTTIDNFGLNFKFSYCIRVNGAELPYLLEGKPKRQNST